MEFCRGVCELLDLMKLDMANFFVQINRSIVEEHSAEYERSQFMKLLDKNPGLLNYLPPSFFLRNMQEEKSCTT